MISTNTVLLGEGSGGTTGTYTTLVANTILLQSTTDLKVIFTEPTTLSGSTFVQLAPNHKMALFGYATTSYNTREATVCAKEL
jgi:hypothetical protein